MIEEINKNWQAVTSYKTLAQKSEQWVQTRTGKLQKVG
jgi:hypothetical protein